MSATIGPIFAFTKQVGAGATFYAEVVGLDPGLAQADSSWLHAANAELVFHAPEDRETPQEVSAQLHFVVWFGVDDVHAAYERARAHHAVIGDFYGDYFFVRDPEGRYVGIHANEGHAHGHDHAH